MPYYLVKCLTRGGWVEAVTILEETDIDRAWAILLWARETIGGSDHVPGAGRRQTRPEKAFLTTA